MAVFNPLVDPSSQAQIERQRQFALLLQQQSMQPTEGQMVSGHYVAPSFTNGLAKLLQGYTGRKLNEDSDVKQSALYQQQFANMQKIMNGEAPQLPNQTTPNTPVNAMQSGAASTPNDASNNNMGGVGPTTDNAQSMATALQTPTQPTQQASFPNQPSSNNFNMANLLRSSAITSMGGDAAGSAYWKQYEPTDATKMAMAAGLDPRQANIDAMSKANYIAPTRLGEGAYNDPKLGVQGLPTAAPAGSINVRNPQTGQWSTQGVQGGLEANSAAQAALVQGKNRQTLADPAMSPTDAQGRPMPTSIDATLHPQQVQQVQNNPNIVGNFNGNKEDILKQINRIHSPVERQQALQAFNSQLSQAQSTQSQPAQAQGVGLALGQKEGAVNAQTELTKKYGDLQAQNSQAQITTSYLQNIKQVAAKAAVGPMSDKIDMVNGLLSLVGSQKATDAVTANDLLDKYAGQIVSRLGTGGLGTDAARALLKEAYPGAHMNINSINEAVDNLVGANEMIKAKASLLSAHGNARDPINYQQKEQAFDQNADPRLWQYKQVAGTPQGKVMLQGIMKQDPQFFK